MRDNPCSVKTYIAHVTGSRKHVVIDENFEAILAVADSYEEAASAAMHIEASNQTFNFEEIYRLYPRKLGKASGLRWLKNNVKSKSRYDRLVEAVNNYSHHCKELGTEDTFIQHFSTWVKRFEDWTNGNMKEVVVPKEQIQRNPLRDIEKLLGGV